jgi:hypothetical protein
MLVRHQADATTRAYIDQESGMLAVAERPRNVSLVSMLSGTGERVPGVQGGAARPDAYLGPSRPRVSRLVGARRRAPKYPLDKPGVYALLSQPGSVVTRRGRPDIAPNRRGPARP